MTEAEWLTCDDPLRMLEWFSVRQQPREPWHVSDRKLRLFGVACVIAVGVGTESDWQRYEDGWEGYDSEAWARRWAAPTAVPDKIKQSDKANFLRTIVWNPWRPVEIEYGCEMCDGSGSVEHHSGNGVVNCPLGYDDDFWVGCKKPSPWLTHADGTVPKLACVIYNERRWSAMPMLADALEESGCDDEVILRWCRGQELCPRCLGKGGWEEDTGGVTPWGEPVSQWVVCDYPCTRVRGWIPRRGPSVRGDFVLDLLLGKE